MKTPCAITKATSTQPSPAELKIKKAALLSGSRAPSRVYRVEKQADGSFTRISLSPEVQRSQSAKSWQDQSDAARARYALGMTQEAFAKKLGITLSTLRSWEQRKREPSGAARTLICIALNHPHIFTEQAT